MASLEEMWAGLKSGLDSGLDQAKLVGVPMVQASIEQWGISVLTEQNKQTQNQLTSAVKTLSTNPSSPIGSAVNSTIQKSVLELYGVHIVLGVAVLLGIGYAMRGR